MRLEWNINDTQMMWGAVSYSVRTPSRLENNLSIVQAVLGGILPDPVVLMTQGNDEFESEQSTSYQIGYRQQFTPKVTLDVATFYNVYANLSSIRLPTGGGISFVSNGTDPDYYIAALPFANDTSGETYGFETNVSWRALSNLNLSANYSLLKMTLHGPPSNIAIDAEGPENQSPQQQFNVRSQWDIRKDLSFDTILYYVDEVSAYQVPDYLRMDMRLGWKINNQMQFDLVAQNLLDDSHREFSSPTDISATEINRSIYANITWRY
jgi:iron complex outermembrane receptor protein